MPIKMYDNVLSTNVDVYQIGLPDPFGANCLIWYDGSKTYTSPNLSALSNHAAWLTINIRRLTPLQ